MTDTIKLGNDGWSTDYLENPDDPARVEPVRLLDSMQEFVEQMRQSGTNYPGDDFFLKSKYVNYMRSNERTDHDKYQDDSPMLERAKQTWDMLFSMDKDGYKPDKWKTNPRPCDDNPAPLRVNIGEDGRIWHDSGAHRLATLRALELEIPELSVGQRDPAWEAAKKANQKLWSALGHPDLADYNTIDNSNTALNDMSASLQSLTADARNSIVVLGAGKGLIGKEFHTRKFGVVGMEPRTNYATMLNSWKRYELKDDTSNSFELRDAAQYPTQFGYEVRPVVALSIYNDIATSKTALRSILERSATTAAHFVSLPSNDETEAWQHAFFEETGGNPYNEVLEALKQRGRYDTEEVVGIDEEGRRILLLKRA